MSFLMEITNGADRLEMQLSSWMMLLFGVVVLLGWLIVCIRIAVRVGREKEKEGGTAGVGGDA